MMGNQENNQPGKQNQDQQKAPAPQKQEGLNHNNPAETLKSEGDERSQDDTLRHQEPEFQSQSHRAHPNQTMEEDLNKPQNTETESDEQPDIDGGF